MSGESHLIIPSSLGEKPSPGHSAPSPSEAPMEEDSQVPPTSSQPSSESELQVLNRTTPPAPTPPPVTLLPSLTAVNADLYTEEIWSRTKEALLVFIGFPDLSPAQVLDALEHAYSGCSIGSIKVSRTFPGFLISSLARQGNLLALAMRWFASPIWTQALLVPLARNGKPAAAAIPLPALTIRQVPYGVLRPLFDNFDDGMNRFFVTGDPNSFSSKARADMIGKVFACEASFIDLKLLTPLTASTNAMTPVAVALYPASVEDFITGLEGRVVVGGGIYYLMPIAERFWINAFGKFHSKGVCQWCGERDHPVDREKCNVGETFLKESDAHFLSKMMITYRVDAATSLRLGIPVTPPAFTPLPSPPPTIPPVTGSASSPATAPSSRVPAPVTRAQNPPPSQQTRVTPQPPPTPESAPNSDALTSTRPTKFQKPNQTSGFAPVPSSKLTDYFKPVQSEAGTENKESSQYSWATARSTAGGGYSYRDAVSGKRNHHQDAFEALSQSPAEYAPDSLWSFTVIPTSPDGNCFYHCLLHPNSPVRQLLPGAPNTTTPILLRQYIIRWFENNREIGEVIIRRSLGAGTNQVRRLLNRIRSNFTWTDYTTILLSAAALSINIVVFSPCSGLNMCSSEVFESYGLNLTFNGEAAILYHQFGSPYEQADQYANHFSLLLLNSESPNSLNAIFSNISARRKVELSEQDIIPILSSDESESLLSDNDEPDLLPLSDRNHIGTYPPSNLAAPSSPPASSNTSTLPDIPKVGVSMSSSSTSLAGLNIFCWNATSLKADNRTLILQDIAKAASVDIFLIQESGMDSAPPPLRQL
jgi:hypothetical protein